jgi:predicted permease
MWTSLKRALRVLRKDLGFTAVAICSLAAGIGTTSALFSFANGMLLRPLPVMQPDRVVAVNTASSTAFGATTTISNPDYVDLRDRNRTFEGLVASAYAPFGFSADRNTLPRMKFGLYVSGNFFQVLGVEPAIGRGFRPDEDQAEGRDAVVVLGHDFWMGQFGGSRSVLGSRIRLNGIEFTVVGVAPERFTGIDQYLRPAMFVPLAMSGRMGQKSVLAQRDVRWLGVKGRLKPGVTVEQAQADLAAIMAALEEMYPQTNRNQRIRVATELDARIAQSPPMVAMVVMLGMLAVCVLLVACANVAGLLLSRARVREREIAVCRAIGAGRGTLVRQLLFENLLVALAGGAAGIGIAQAGTAFFSSFPFPSDLPLVWPFVVDQRVLLFTLVVSVASTLLFGLAPAWRASNPDLVTALKAGEADRAAKRLWGRNALVAGQVALSLVLLIVSAVLVQGFRGQLKQGPGFRTDHLFLTGFDARLARYSDDQMRRFYKDLLERTRSAPGVRSAALSSVIPLISGDSVGVVPEGYPLPRGEASIPVFDAYVSEGYFQTMGIPVRQGRGFLESDRQDTRRVAVVNEHMAARFWPDGDALGKRFHLREASGPLVEIVGIAANAKYFWIAEPAGDFVYLPFQQDPHSAMTLFVESNASDAGTLAPTVRSVVRSLDPDMPTFDVRTMHDLFTQRAVKTSNMLVETVAAMGLIGLALAIVGLYGVVSYSVSRRTREIGIRMAVGADRRSVVWMVLKQGLVLGSIGVVAGLAASVFVCRLVTSAAWVASFNRVDPLVFAVLPVLILIVMLMGTFGPVRRASQVDPIRALRDE